MRVRAGVLAAALLATGASGVSASAVGAADGASRDGALQQARDRWLLQQRPALQRSGMLPRALATASVGADGTTRAAAEEASGFSTVQLAEDLDGRGGGDLLDIRNVFTKGKALAVVHARDGQSGRVLWTRSVPSTGSFVFARALAAGAGRSDVLVLEYGGSGEETVLTVTALDGRNGAARWKQVRRGSYGFDGDTGEFTSDAVPAFDGLLSSPGGREDVVLSVFDTRGDERSAEGTVTVSALRGTDGKARSLGPSVTSTVGLPIAVPLPDATGDGRGDVVVVSPGGTDRLVTDPRSPVPPGLAQLRSGVDGRAVWSRTDLVLGPQSTAYPVGAASGGATDVAVVSGPMSRPGPGVRGALGQPADADSTLTVVRGNDGTTRWTAPGSIALKAAGGIVVTALTRDVVGPRQTDTTLVVAARDAAGAQLWELSRTVTTESGAGFVITFNPVGIAGDLHPDGRDEVVFGIAGIDGEGGLEIVEGVVDGRTGAVTDVDPRWVLGAAGSLTGKGDDVVTASGSKDISLTATRGLTTKVLWKRTVPSTVGAGDAYTFTGPRRGRCADVVLLARSSTTNQVALLSPDGRLRWSFGHARTDTRATKAVAAKAFTSRCG